MVGRAQTTTTHSPLISLYLMNQKTKQLWLAFPRGKERQLNQGSRNGMKVTFMKWSGTAERGGAHNPPHQPMKPAHLLLHSIKLI